MGAGPSRALSSCSQSRGNKPSNIDRTQPAVVVRKQQQLLEGHAANFADAPVDDSGEAIGLFSFMERKSGSLIQATALFFITGGRF